VRRHWWCESTKKSWYLGFAEVMLNVFGVSYLGFGGHTPHFGSTEEISLSGRLTTYHFANCIRFIDQDTYPKCLMHTQNRNREVELGIIAWSLIVYFIPNHTIMKTILLIPTSVLRNKVGALPLWMLMAYQLIPFKKYRRRYSGC
jgi:hypothetical protein